LAAFSVLISLQTIARRFATHIAIASIRRRARELAIFRGDFRALDFRQLSASTFVNIFAPVRKALVRGLPDSGEIGSLTNNPAFLELLPTAMLVA